ncbi:MAG: hypothetical protein ACRCX8_16225 [Sarcina sp.]
MQDLEEKIIEICDCDYEYFLNKQNVIGIALGYKVTNGIKTTEKCLQVLVEQKVDLATLTSNDIIPLNYNSIITDVIEVGVINSYSLTAKLRPMLFGYSIGPATVAGAGTAGYFVNDTQNKDYILSNNHVLAGENSVPIGTAITQPGIGDGGNVSTDTVGALSNFIPLQFTTSTTKPDNFVDAAIAKISDVSLVRKQVALSGPVSGVAIATLNLDVKKVGRTTELTTGQITGLNATVEVGYGSGRTALFKNQIITTAMSTFGDSGSLLADTKNNAVGLLFAGSSTTSIHNPILDVLQALNVHFAFSM